MKSMDYKNVPIVKLKFSSELSSKVNEEGSVELSTEITINLSIRPFEDNRGHIPY